MILWAKMYKRQMESNKQIIVLIAISMCMVIAQAKIYRKCDLALELANKHKFSRTLLPSWICMIEQESHFDTRKKVAYSPTVGSLQPHWHSFGIFQINSKTYCREGFAGGRCKIRCEELLSDDITKAAQCAQIVLNTEGFKAWRGWDTKCRSKGSPPLRDCWSGGMGG